MKSSRLSKEIHSQGESFELQVHQMKKFGFQINKKKITEGGWSFDQNKIYLEFLIQYQDDFKTEIMRRKTRVFYRISKLLKRRTPDQCRSHHQKLLTKHKGDLDEVIQELKSKTCNEVSTTKKSSQNQKLKNTSLCTVDLAKDIKIMDEIVSRQIIDIQDYFSVEMTNQSIQLNIDLDHIKMWQFQLPSRYNDI